MESFNFLLNPSGKSRSVEPSQNDMELINRFRIKMEIDTKLKQFASFLNIDTNNKQFKDIFKQIVEKLETEGLSGEQQSKLNKLKGISDNVLTMDKHLEEFNEKVQELGELVYIRLKKLASDYGIDTTKKQPKEIFTQIIQVFQEPSQQEQKAELEGLKELLAQRSRSLTSDDVRTLEELRTKAFVKTRDIFTNTSKTQATRRTQEDRKAQEAARVKAQEAQEAARVKAQEARVKAQEARVKAREAQAARVKAQEEARNKNMIRLMILFI